MEVYVGRDNGILKDVYRLDDTRQARSGFEMADLEVH